MKVVGIIPARWQSSRFPGKPLASILGKSLIQRTYENALSCSLLNAVAIATDDARIYEHAKSFGASVFMSSPSCPTGTDRVWEVMTNHFSDADIIVNIQGDEPCLNPEVIEALITKLISTPEAIFTTPVAKLTDLKSIMSPQVVKCVFDKTGKALYFSRSPIPFVRNAAAELPYYRHLGVYCFKKDFLDCYVHLKRTALQEFEDLEQLKVLEHGFPIHVCEVMDQATGVDTPEDLKTVEKFLCQKENISL